MKPNKFDAVIALVGPNKHFGVTIEGVLEWHEDPSEKPTEEAIQAKLKELEDEYEKQAYARSRQAEYPSIQELVVALYDESDKASIIEKRNAVKAKYPKPG